jgi:hypothetical protein
MPPERTSRVGEAGAGRVEGGVGPWSLVLCADCEELAGVAAVAGADRRN